MTEYKYSSQQEVQATRLSLGRRLWRRLFGNGENTNGKQWKNLSDVSQDLTPQPKTKRPQPTAFSNFLTEPGKATVVRKGRTSKNKSVVGSNTSKLVTAAQVMPLPSTTKSTGIKDEATTRL